MILVDTSVWIAHFRKGEPRLAALLEDTQVLTHPFIVGELALGSLERRSEILEALDNLPSSPEATHSEVISLVDQHDLAGSGIGWVNAHLLASALLSDSPLWTLDKRLSSATSRLGLSV